MQATIKNNLTMPCMRVHAHPPTHLYSGHDCALDIGSNEVVPLRHEPLLQLIGREVEGAGEEEGGTCSN